MKGDLQRLLRALPAGSSLSFHVGENDAVTMDVRVGGKSVWVSWGDVFDMEGCLATVIGEYLATGFSEGIARRKVESVRSGEDGL